MLQALTTITAATTVDAKTEIPSANVTPNATPWTAPTSSISQRLGSTANQMGVCPKDVMDSVAAVSRVEKSTTGSLPQPLSGDGLHELHRYFVVWRAGFD